MVGSSRGFENGYQNDASSNERECRMHYRRSPPGSYRLLQGKQFPRTDCRWCRVHRVCSPKTVLCLSVETDLSRKYSQLFEYSRSVLRRHSLVYALLQGNLHTKEYLISELMQALNLNNEKLAVLAALLGNYLLPDDKLKEVYAAANINLLTEVWTLVIFGIASLCFRLICLWFCRTLLIKWWKS